MAGFKAQIEKNKNLWAHSNWDEIAAFIGPNAEKYRAYYDKTKPSMVQKGRPGFQFNWHWPALIPILGIPWAVARRDWAYAGTMIAVVILINVITIFFGNVNFSFMFFLAPILAKQTYFQNIMNKISKIKETIPEGLAQTEAIKAAGGLNMTHGYIAGGICAALFGLSITAFIFTI